MVAARWNVSGQYWERRASAGYETHGCPGPCVEGTLPGIVARRGRAYPLYRTAHRTKSLVLTAACTNCAAALRPAPEWGYSPPLLPDTGPEIEVHRYPGIRAVPVRAQCNATASRADSEPSVGIANHSRARHHPTRTRRERAVPTRRDQTLFASHQAETAYRCSANRRGWSGRRRPGFGLSASA